MLEQIKTLYHLVIDAEEHDVARAFYRHLWAFMWSRTIKNRLAVLASIRALIDEYRGKA